MGKALRLNRYINNSEFGSFFNSFQDSEARHELVFLIMAYGGLRVNEAVRINMKDFLNPRQTILRVINTKTANKTKNKPPRIEPVQFPSWLGQHITDYIIKHQHKFKKGYLFYPDGHGSKKDHLTTHAIRMFLCRKRRKLGGTFQDSILYVNYESGREQRIYRIGTHSFRRWYGTQIYKSSNKDLVLTKELMRHTDIETTELYINSFELMQKAPRIIESLRNPWHTSSIKLTAYI